jgi:hypothetical protein
MHPMKLPVYKILSCFMICCGLCKAQLCCTDVNTAVFGISYWWYAPDKTLLVTRVQGGRWVSKFIYDNHACSGDKRYLSYKLKCLHCQHICSDSFLINILPTETRWNLNEKKKQLIQAYMTSVSVKVLKRQLHNTKRGDWLNSNA